jgi:hypothetical protein
MTPKRGVKFSPRFAATVPLTPEFIAPQDGAEKQDCERKALNGRLPPLRPMFRRSVHLPPLAEASPRW